MSRRVARGRLAPASMLALSGTAFFAPTPASADGAGRWHFAGRTGYGLPVGKYAEVQTVAGLRDTDNAISDDTHGVIPLWVDAGYRVAPRLMLGAYFVYGIVLPKTAAAGDPLGGGCPEDFECSASGIRLGVQAQYAFTPGAPVAPWAGIALGYERVQSDLDGEFLGVPVDAKTAYAGPDLLQLQGGADLQLTDVLSLGPFAALSAMRYTSCSLTLAGNESPCELEDGGWHGWVVLGVRVAVEP